MVQRRNKQHGLDTNPLRSDGISAPRVALILAGTGLFWILAVLIGDEMGWSNRTRAFFDLAALAGFGFALWQVFLLWRARQSDNNDM